MADGLFSSLADKYRSSVDMRKRTYGESLLKSLTNTTSKPISNTDFTEKELVALDDLIKEHYQEKLRYFTRPKKELLEEAKILESNSKRDFENAKKIEPEKVDFLQNIQNRAKLQLIQAQQLREAAQGKIPQDFSFQYTGYGGRTAQNKFEKDPAGWAQTLGRFRYKINSETGEYQVYDSYDFNNEVHKYAAQDYAQMNPIKRMGSALANTFLGGDQYALGEAFISGKNAVPVEIKRRIGLGNTEQIQSPIYADPFVDTTR
jgi:hypothetical protein